MKKCSGAGQTTDGTMAHEHAGYPRLQISVGICNSYSLPTTKKVARTRPSVKFTYIAFVLCVMYSGILGHNTNNIKANPGGGVDDYML